MLAASRDEDARGNLTRREGGGFERRVGAEPPEVLRAEVAGVIKKTIGWPSAAQTAKGLVTGGVARSWRYLREKAGKHREAKRRDREMVEGGNAAGRDSAIA